MLLLQLGKYLLRLCEAIVSKVPIDVNVILFVGGSVY